MLSLDKKIETITNLFKIYADKILEIDSIDNIYTIPFKDFIDKVPKFVQEDDKVIPVKRYTLDLFLKLQKNSKNYKQFIRDFCNKCNITVDETKSISSNFIITTKSNCYIAIFNFINLELKSMDFEKYEVEVL